MSAEHNEFADYTDYTDIVMQEARRLRAQLSHAIELDEAVAIATEGLLEALRRVDVDRSEAERRAYVRLRVRGRLRDSVGEFFQLPRRAWRQVQMGSLEARLEPTSSGTDRYLREKLSLQGLRAQVADALDARRIRSTLDFLPQRSAELLLRIYFEGRTLADAARRIGISASWASRLRHEALSLIRERCESRLDSEQPICLSEGISL